jgi:threonine dehydratase
MAIGRNSEDALIPIVASIEVHRRQIIFDALDTETGEVSRGRIDATAPTVDDVTVSDEEILAAMRLLFERLKTVAEPSGATALAAVLASRVEISAGVRVRVGVGVTISGGDVGVDRFAALLGQAVRSSQRREGET